jgi:hypothetical protein
MTSDDPDRPLPDLIQASQAFVARLPSQRVIDLLARLEPGVKFGELIEAQPPRMIAFRALLRDYPTRDPASLWLHAYDVEVALVEVDPFLDNGQKPWQSSASTTS